MFQNHVIKSLSAYIHSELSPEEVDRVGEHLGGCRDCRVEYEEIGFGAQMAAQLVSEVAPVSLWDEIEASLDAVKAVGVTRRTGSIFTIPAFKYSAVVAITLLIAFTSFTLMRLRPERESGHLPSWEVTRIAGNPAIGERRIEDRGRLVLGEWLTTDGTSRAQISVGQIGEVKIEPNSRIRLVEARGDEHRLSLSIGRMEAFIWAPPRQFYVDTPSAVAVDLGCSYTLEVNRDGVGRLHVTLGWVAFEWQGRESFVPAGAICLTRPEFGPGTPYFDDASTEFIRSLAGFDISGAGASRTSALENVLASARKRDAMTLWHLLTRTVGSDRGKVYDRLARLIPPPRNATREGVINGDHAMIDDWWVRLELGDTDWWRMWKGPLPTQSK